MENQTIGNQTKFTFRPTIWYSNVVISGILGVLSLYLVTALIFHQVKVEESRKERFFQLSLENKFAVLSKVTCIAIGFASLFRLWVGFSGMFFEYHAVFNKHFTKGMTRIGDFKSICEAISKLENITFAAGSGLVYLFLWFRQRVFYIHPSLNTLNNKVVKTASTSIMVIWVLYFVSLWILTFLFVQHHFNREGGCLIKESFQYILPVLVWSWCIVSILMQILLLVLFIYPIMKQTSWQNQQNHESNSCLKKRVKKAVIFTLICLLTDLLSVILSQIFYVRKANIAIFPFTLNLVTNHLITIACFDNWKQLFWPWKLKPRKQLDVTKSERISSISTPSIPNQSRGNQSSRYYIDKETLSHSKS